MGTFEAFATAVVLGPRAAPLRDAFLSAAMGPIPRGADVIVAASPLGDDGAVLRVGSKSTAALLMTLHSALSPLTGILGDDPFARKW